MRSQEKESNVRKSDFAKLRTVKRGTPVLIAAYPPDEEDSSEDDAAKDNMSSASGTKVSLTTALIKAISLRGRECKANCYISFSIHDR